MKHQTHTPGSIKKSSKTRYIETVQGVLIYSHTLTNVYGSFLTVHGDTEWIAHETLEDARAQSARGPAYDKILTDIFRERVL